MIERKKKKHKGWGGKCPNVLKQMDLFQKCQVGQHWKDLVLDLVFEIYWQKNPPIQIWNILVLIDCTNPETRSRPSLRQEKEISCPRLMLIKKSFHF